MHTAPDKYTYYKNKENTRAFVVVEVEGYPFGDVQRVILVEWGKADYIIQPLAVFNKLVEDKELILFTPKL